MDAERTEVDGVPTFWKPGADAGDQYKVALVFRAGRADETLARSGITHLVEHLALHHLGHTGEHYNGMVDAITTMFVAQGDAGEAGEFLGSVCRALGDLPLDRLEAEKQILRTEADGRSSGVMGGMLLWRYGPATYGLPGYHEFGITEHSTEDVTAWARRWITRGNAALGIIGGPPPAGLRLDLADGARMPPPEPTSALHTTPAFFTGEVNGAGMNSVVPRNIAATVYSRVLARRLHRVLRLEKALSYATWADYSARDASNAHITAFADGLADNHTPLTAGFVQEIEGLAESEVGAEELDEAVSGLLTQMRDPEAVRGLAMASAVREVVGYPPRSYAEIMAELAEISPGQLRECARAVRESALLMLPHEQEPSAGHYVRAPWKSPGAVDGIPLNSIDALASTSYLLVAQSGLTRVDGHECVTVRYDSVASVLAWPDGARRLIGFDGFVVHVEPALWTGSQQLTPAIDGAVPPDRVVRMPARPPEKIPRPEPGSNPGMEPMMWPHRPGGTGLRGKMSRVRTGMAWDDPALAEALPGVSRGNLGSGLELLAATRGRCELRALRLENLAQSAVGHGAALARLAAERPHDPDVLLWYGSTRIQEAWHVRSGYRAEHVSGGQFETFWLILAGAYEPLQRAADLLPDDPVPLDCLQWRAIGLQADRPELDRIWAEILRRAPAFYAGHYSRAQAICEKWYGSRDEVREFAESVADSAKPGDPIVAVLAEAYLENEFEQAGELGSYLSAAAVQSRLAAAADKWMSDPVPHCRAIEAHHLFGAAFYYGRDHDRARRHLAHADSRIPSALPWEYLETAGKVYLAIRKDLGLK